jgi:hypothetical protein
VIVILIVLNAKLVLLIISVQHVLQDIQLSQIVMYVLLIIIRTLLIVYRALV